MRSLRMRDLQRLKIYCVRLDFVQLCVSNIRTLIFGVRPSVPGKGDRREGCLQKLRFGFCL